MKSADQPRFGTLAVAEPFRIFFPLGVLIGISGVSLWPLFFLGIHQSFYPGVMHARLMIEGFMGAFVFGFLATAIPRLTDQPPMTGRSLIFLLAIFLSAVGLHIAHQHAVGDSAFLVAQITFLAAMAPRVLRKRSEVPPSFALVGCGYLCGVVGTVCILVGPLAQNGSAVMLGMALLYQAFGLQLLLGIGAFLLPRLLFVAENRSETRGIERGQPGILAAATSAVLVGTFVLETCTPWTRTAVVVRSCVSALFLGLSLCHSRRKLANTTAGRCGLTALVFLIFGLAFPAFWPAYRVAGLHVVFIGGFTLATFAVATRVVLGHSGQSHRFSMPLPALLAAATLLVAAATLRVVGDFSATRRLGFLNEASYLWMAAAALWAWKILPAVRTADRASDSPA